MMDKIDVLIESLIKQYKDLFKQLKAMSSEKESEDDSEDKTETPQCLTEDQLTNAMVKAIKQTRSPHRTIGTNY